MTDTARCLRLACLATACSVAVGAVPASDTADPLALLRGVENARDAIRSGRIEYTGIRRRADTPGDDPFSLAVTFDGVKRRSTLKQRTIVMDSSGGLSGEQKFKRLRAMNNDREAFVRAGLAQWQDEESRSIWDGANFSQYFVGQSADYRNHHNGTPEFLADPRLFGLKVWNKFRDTPLTNLGYQMDKHKVVLDGSEEIAGRRVWRVAVRFPAFGDPTQVCETKYWIEDREGFRVHRVIYRDKIVHLTIDSEYNDKIGRGRLPSSVIERDVRDGKWYTELHFTVTRAEYDVNVDPETFTWAGMDLAVGTPVSDERIHRRIGYWNGSGLSEHLLEAQKIGTEAEQAAEVRRKSLWWAGAGGIGVILLAAALVAWRRLRDRASA